MRIALALFLSLPAAALAQHIAIAGYAIPTATGPEAIAAGPDGAMWFTLATGYIGRINEAGVITEYPIPSGAGQFYGITAGPDGALWFTESAGYIGRITTAGVIISYPVRTAFAYPYGITAGPDGALWFKELYANQVGRVTASGVVTQYPVPGEAALAGITTGPDGALWFAGTGIVGRLTTAGEVTEYPLPGYEAAEGITTGPDGALWFAVYLGSDIGRITTSGAITQHIPPDFGEGYGAIAASPHGDLWVTGNSSNGDSRIEQVLFTAAALSVAPATGTYPSDLTFTGSGFAPGESVRVYGNGIGSLVIASAAADSTGSFTATGRAPGAAYGPRIFLSFGQTSGRVGAANFSMQARLILTPDSGAPGSTVSAQGYGFGEFDSVDVYWNNPRTFLGTAAAITAQPPARAILRSSDRPSIVAGPSELAGAGVIASDLRAGAEIRQVE